MKQRSLLSGLVLLIILALAAPASAGEVKGPSDEGGATGGATPIEGFWTGDGAASICSFSGLNDEINELEPTRTQSYGTFLVLIMNAANVDIKTAMEILNEAPDDFCNPTRAPWGNPHDI